MLTRSMYYRESLPLQYWFVVLGTFSALSPKLSAAAFMPPRNRIPKPHYSLLRTPEHGAKLGTYGFDEAGQNLSISPGDDFFAFANGKYMDNLEIPRDEASWGNFDILSKTAQEKVRGILEDDLKVGGKMGKFYASYMNESLVNTLDTSVIKSTLDELLAIRNARDYAAIAGRSSGSLLPSPFGIGISPDSQDETSYSVMIDQAAIGLPRDYYLQPTYADKKAAYTKFAETLLSMVDWPESKTASKDILALEEKLANASWSEAEMRDPIKNYNVMAGVSDLESKAPGFDWATFLQEAGNLPRGSKLVVGALGGVAGIAEILGKTDVALLRSYAAFHFVASVANLMSDRFVKASFDFNKVMSGRTELPQRWKRGVSSANGHMGEAIGQEFVKRYFPPAYKVQVEGLTQDLKKAFAVRLSKLDWMTQATKQKALAKLASFSIQVGYPKKWRSYDKLHVEAHDLYGNVERAAAFEWERCLDKLGKPVDRDEWMMGPQTVNAYNMPLFNQVVFPAAILQPPFFDPRADMAVNYGAIGGIIGHEMTHGFDDSGRHYDEHGRLKDWWTDTDVAEFNKRAVAYGNQFASFDIGVPDVQIKADLTMGEDIADLGGLNLALEAYRSSVDDKTLSVVSHQEGLRRVFLGWAQVWREKRRPDALLSQLASDPHPPAIARVDIPCRNIDDWYEAFGVKKSDKNFLPPDARAVIW
jgi:putative endopeptidase